MPLDLTPKAYRLDRVTLDMLEAIRKQLQANAAPGASQVTEVAAIRFAIHSTYASIRRGRPKKSAKNPE